MKKKLIVISAVWCPSCLILSKHLNNIEKIYENLEIIKYDYDLDEENIKKYNVGNKLPIMIIEDDNNNEIRRMIGEKNYDEVKNFIENEEKYI